MITIRLTRWLAALWLALSGVVVADAALAADATVSPTAFRPLTALERLGSRLFFDTRLSEPEGQACASCHDPNFAFTDPDKVFPTSEGATAGLFGNRNAPTAMYTTTAGTEQALHFDDFLGVWRGGQFWDGRAQNLTEQAKAPFLNPLEMGNPAQPDRNLAVARIVEKVRGGEYAALFRRVFGADAFADPALAFDRIATALAAFERTPAFGQYTSKFDAVLAGRATFTALESQGQTLFNQFGCGTCHPLDPIASNVARPGTDFSYHNIGLPKNPRNRFYGMRKEFNAAGKDFVDLGLGGVFPEGSSDRTDQAGKYKVPSVRNVALTAPYGHNGYFNTLRGIVDFYSTRDSKPRCKNRDGADIDVTEEVALRRACWPAPEMPATVDRGVRGGRTMGNMALEPQEIGAIVAFLNTLTDGWRPSLRF